MFCNAEIFVPPEIFRPSSSRRNELFAGIEDWALFHESSDDTYSDTGISNSEAKRLVSLRRSANAWNKRVRTTDDGMQSREDVDLLTKRAAVEAASCMLSTSTSSNNTAKPIIIRGSSLSRMEFRPE